MAAGAKCRRPSPVLFDCLVDVRGNPTALKENIDDTLEMTALNVRERSPFSLLQPLIADLVPADPVVPHLLRNATATQRALLIDPDDPIVVLNLLDDERAPSHPRTGRPFHSAVIENVQVGQLFA